MPFCVAISTCRSDFGPPSRCPRFHLPPHHHANLGINRDYLGPQHPPKAFEMFNPSVGEGGPATATRSRRRQRPKSSDSLVQQPKAKRQRLPLTEQTFVNPDVQPEMVEAAKADKIASLDPKQDSPSENFHPTPRKELNVRAKKSKHGDRAANKGDGSLVLVGSTRQSLITLPDVEIYPSPFDANISNNRRARAHSPFRNYLPCQTEYGPTGQVSDPSLPKFFLLCHR